MSIKSDRLLLKIDKDGIANIVETNLGQLDDESVLFLIDEKNFMNWLYIGKNVSFIHKRGALRIANSLKKFGYEINGSILGRKCADLKILDKTSDKSETDMEKMFYSLIENKNIESKSTEIKNKIDSQSNVYAKNEIIIRPLKEVYSSNENRVEEKPIKTGIGEEKTVVDSEATSKFGVLLTAILQEFPEIRIIKQSQGEFDYVIEGPYGQLCSLKMDKGKMIISSNSTFGDEDRKIKIQQKFINLSKKLSEI